jgi:hypothetical protein
VQLASGCSLRNLGQVTEHLIDIFGRLRVQLVGALGRDHVDHFVDHRDVGAFEITLGDSAEPVLRRLTGDWSTRSLGLDREIIAGILQTFRINECRELNYADLRRLRLTLNLDTDSPVGADRETLGCFAIAIFPRGVAWDRNRRLQLISFGGH